MRSGKTILQFSFVDDISILGLDRIISESAAVAQKKIDSLSKLGPWKTGILFHFIYFLF